MDFLAASESTWSISMVPTEKYLASGCAKYQPPTVAVGNMAYESVSDTPQLASQSKSRNRVLFSV